MPSWNAGETGRGRRFGRNVPAGIDDLLAYTLAQQEVRVVEVLEEPGEERVPVCLDRLLDSPPKTLASTPSGLSAVLSRYGGTDAMKTALVTPFDPYFPI